MTGWTNWTGRAVALDRESVDTDQLIPARFMSTPRSEGYGPFLFHDLRQDPSFPLTRHPEATVLIARRNFGSGSSREAAVYALADFGIRAVIAPTFGDIFASNAVNNGILPARVDAETADALIANLGDGTAEAIIDMDAGIAIVGGRSLAFDLDPIWRDKLINGLDDIDLTRAHADEIAAYRARVAAEQPWRFPAQGRDG